MAKHKITIWKDSAVLRMKNKRITLHELSDGNFGLTMQNKDGKFKKRDKAATSKVERGGVLTTSLKITKEGLLGIFQMVIELDKTYHERHRDN